MHFYPPERLRNPELPKKADNETLRQLPLKQLVSMIVQQQQVIEQQQKAIKELTEAVNRLKVSQGLDSQISSKPPRQTYSRNLKKPKNRQPVMLKPLSASLVDSLVIQAKRAKAM